MELHGDVNFVNMLMKRPCSNLKALQDSLAAFDPDPIAAEPRKFTPVFLHLAQHESGKMIVAAARIFLQSQDKAIRLESATSAFKLSSAALAARPSHFVVAFPCERYLFCFGSL